MPLLRSGEVSLEIDDEGYLTRPEQWNESVACALALADGIAELGDEHWRVVRVLRSHFLEFGIAPAIRKLCQQTGLRLQQIYDLFPLGPARGACKVAGLPKPVGCV